MHKETRGIFSTLAGYTLNKIILLRREACGGTTERRYWQIIIEGLSWIGLI